MLPPPIIKRHGDFWVVRDDLLEGGTKRRVIQPLVERMDAQEFVYASPAYGYAQYALAVAAREAGKRATIFTAKRKQPHRLTLAAHRAGAKVVMVPYGYLSNVQAKARAYAAKVGAANVPFGVDTPESIAAIADAARLINADPAEVWTVSGSGTLSRGLQTAWPQADFHTVLIGTKNPYTGNAKTYRAPEKFE